MSRILVTGASGFIGRQTLAPLAAQGHDVHAVHHTTPVAVAGVTPHQLDLRDAGDRAALLARVQPTHLLHAAWTVTPGVYLKSPDNLGWLSASLDLLDAFARHGGRRAVLVGTCFEYDLQEGFCRESGTSLSPATLYASCKHALHVAADAWSAAVGVELAWARPFFLYGPHEHPKRLVASVVRALLAGQRAACSHGRQRRDFMHVADLGAALAQLTTMPLTGAVNLGTGEAVSVGDIIRTVARELDGDSLVDWGAVAVPADDPPLVLADTRRWLGAGGRAPTFDVASGLRQTIDWWRAQERS